MHEWQNNSGQMGSDQGHQNVWQGSYNYMDNAVDNLQQNWPQAMPGQQAAYQQQHAHQQLNGHAQAAPSSSNFFDTPASHDHSNLSSAHHSLAGLGQGNLSHAQNQFTLDDSFPQHGGSGQTMQPLDNFAPNLYGQSSKAAQEVPNTYSHSNFQFPEQSTAAFHGGVSQFTLGPQSVQQPQQQQPPTQQYRPAASTPVQPQPQQLQQQQQQQRFDVVPQSFSPVAGYPQTQQQHRPAQPDRVFSGSPPQYHMQDSPLPQPVRPQQAPQSVQQQTSQEAFSVPGSAPTPNHADFHQQSPPANYQQQARLMPQQLSSYEQQMSTAPLHTSSSDRLPIQQFQHQQQQRQLQQPSPTQNVARSAPPSTTPQPVPAASPPTQHLVSEASPALAEQPIKKRKRVLKKDTEPESRSSVEPVAQPVSSAPATIPPSSTKQELADLARFKQSGAKSFPPISGAPFLMCEGTTKLSNPKGYDRLAPMVAPPTQSGKRIMPEMPYDLPCEIQGRFADKYKPSPHFTGKPEDREQEAKPLLIKYQQEMRALGNRKPKYADYPYVYQEQLKADEAAKAKAQRKAKKEEEEERKKPIRAEVRPKDPVDGAVWDVLGIVHLDPSVTRSQTLIANAVLSLGEIMMKLRAAMTKAKTELDQATKDGRPANEIQMLKRTSDERREMYMRACEAAEAHGDDAVLENLGGHQKAMLGFVNTLINCFKSADLSGKMPKAVLRLMARASITKKVAETVKLENVRKRFAEKGDAEVKELAKMVALRVKKDSDTAINGSAMDAAKSMSPSLGPASSAASAASASNGSKSLKPSLPAAAKPASESSPNKRPLDDDAAESRPGKKINVDGSSSSIASKLGASKSAPANVSQNKLAASKSRASSSLAAKIRSSSASATKADTAAKSNATKSDHMSPTPMDVDQAGGAKKPKPDSKQLKSAPAKSASSTSSLLSSSIGSLLDSINTPKADAQTSRKDVARSETPETPEQKALRLRKEARRSLRVKWKPESELTEIRLFHKEAAEDEDNMTKDAADDRSEGMMLKQRANFTDEDDEDDELPYRPWEQPKLADLSRIPQDYRDQAYITRGGTQTFHTDEQKAMEEREQRELMVVYTDISDIPPTPKSPAPEPDYSNSDARVAHLPTDAPYFEEMQQRWKDSRQSGADAAVYYACKRLEARNDPATKLDSLLGALGPSAATSSTAEPTPETYNYNMTPPQQYAQPMFPSPSLSQRGSQVSTVGQVITLLTSDKVKNWRDPNPYDPAAPQTQRRFDYVDPTVQAAASFLEDIFGRYKGHPFPATQPPSWLVGDEERVREWWAGFHKDTAARAKKEADDQARAAAEAAARQQAQPDQAQSHQDAWAAWYQQQQQYQQQQEQTHQQQPQQDQYAQYMAMFQQLQNAQNQPQTQVPAVAASGSSQFGDDQLQALLAQINQPQQGQGQPQDSFGLNPNDQGYQQLMMLAQLQQQQQQQPQQNQQTHQAQQSQQSQHNNEKRSQPHQHGGLSYDDDDYTPDDRDMDYGNGRDGRGDWDWDQRDRHDRNDHHEGRHYNKHEKHGKGGRKGNAPGGATLAPHRPVNKALIGTKPCVFWQQGKCARGDKCTFRHDD